MSWKSKALAGGGAFVGFGAADLVMDGIGAARRAAPKADLRAVQHEQREAALNQLQRLQDLQKVGASNIAQLRRFAPELVEQILAGRRLPDGATILGQTQPRLDDLQQLGIAMAQGGMGPPDAMTSALAGLGAYQ